MEQHLNAPPIPLKALKLSRTVDECESLVGGSLAAERNERRGDPTPVDGAAG